VNVALDTNTAVATLELRELQPLSGVGALVCFLVVKSGAFAAAIPFAFAKDSLSHFVSELEMMAEEAPATSGAARLEARLGGQYLGVDRLPGARVKVHGELRDDSPHEQLLRFSFEVADRCLSGLATELRKALQIRRP
jgi:hypothetical protein